MTRVFPRTGVTEVSLSAAHAQGTCRHLVTSFSRNEAGLLVNARVISGNLSFSGIDMMNVLGTSSVLGCPSFHTCRRTFVVVTRIDNETKEGNGHNLIVLRAGGPALPMVKRIMRGSCRNLCRNVLRREEAFRCPPFFRLVGICMGRGCSGMYRRTDRRLDGALED